MTTSAPVDCVPPEGRAQSSSSKPASFEPPSNEPLLEVDSPLVVPLLEKKPELVDDEKSPELLLDVPSSPEEEEDDDVCLPDEPDDEELLSWYSMSSLPTIALQPKMTDTNMIPATGPAQRGIIEDSVTVVDGVGKPWRAAMTAGAVFALIFSAACSKSGPTPEDLEQQRADAAARLRAAESAQRGPNVVVHIPPPRSADAGPCNCVPNDPLCSCL